MCQTDVALSALQLDPAPETSREGPQRFAKALNGPEEVNEGKTGEKQPGDDRGGSVTRERKRRMDRKRLKRRGRVDGQGFQRKVGDGRTRPSSKESVCIAPWMPVDAERNGEVEKHGGLPTANGR